MRARPSKGVRRASVVVALLLFAAQPAAAVGKPRIAIIIDDLGYSLSLGRRVTALPGAVTCAVLPTTPRGRQLAEEANAAGKEVLLHLPLQAQQEDGEMEPGGISLDMTRAEFARTFAADMQSVPNVIGVNSHRGSLLTRHPGHMTWLMEEIKKRGDLFFVDSYTTHESIALRFAHESGVPAVRRDVFLDPDDDPATVAREFQRLKNIARQKGLAVAIGHPYPSTIEFLEHELPKLADAGIELISISELIRLKTASVNVAAMEQEKSGGEDGLLR